MTRFLETSLITSLAAAFLALSVWVYWPGNEGPPMLDDRSNVAVLAGLEERAEFASDYVFSNRSGPLGRPLSMYSFVLEELYFSGDISVRKSVNIFLHAACGGLVMWLLSLLLAHAGVPGYRWFGLLGGALWLFSPLYVSTVLYVVQRMAILSTFFMLLTCIVYAYWRRILFSSFLGYAGFLILLVCFALALFSKENAILLLPLLVALEVLWFAGRDGRGEVVPALRKYSLALLWAGMAVAPVLLIYKFDSFVAGYASRDFTLDERLLTQTRIVWDYLAQLTWPDLPRMGVFHDDYVVSTSLLQPLTTLVAVLAWVMVALTCIVLLRWRSGQLLVAAISVFVIGHLLESTLISLELYFEHRNYFPGVGYFLLIVTALGLIARRWPQTAPPVLVWLGVWVIVLVGQTGSQVQIWSSAALLRLNHVTQHPNSYRANEEMAIHLATVGALDAAMDYSSRARALASGERTGDHQLRDIAMYCLAGRQVPEELFTELGQINPQRPFAVVNSMQGVAKIMAGGTCAESEYLGLADRMAQIFLSQDSVATASPNFYTVLAGMENDLQRYDYAFAYMEKSLAQVPSNVVALLMQLHFASALERFEAVEDVKARLRSLGEQGLLNREQTQTLALYGE